MFCKIASIACLFFSLGLHADLPESRVDVVVIGGGVGGLTSAIYLARGGVAPLVLQGKNPGGAIIQSKTVQNWPGDLEISGVELMAKITEQAQKNGVILSEEEMVSVDFSSRPFVVTVQDIYDSSKQRKILAQACIIAMGAKHRPLDVKGEKEYEFRGVYTCAFCDGPLYKGKDVVVVGGGDLAVLDAEYLSGIAQKVYVLVRGEEFKGAEKARKDQMLLRQNVEVLYSTEVKEIKGSAEGVTSIIIADKDNRKREIPAEAVFLAIGSVPNTAPFIGQLELDAQGYIVVKNHAETSVPGVFAVGDIADPKFKQAVSAGGEGAKAAIQAQMYLSKQLITTVASVKKVGAPIAGVREIATMQELQQILRSSQIPVLVDFYAPWCPPCQKITPLLDTWAKELQGKVLICKVNIEVGKELTSAYKIRSMPSLLQIDANGREIMRKVGPQEITQHINTLKAI